MSHQCFAFFSSTLASISNSARHLAGHAALWHPRLYLRCLLSSVPHIAQTLPADSSLAVHLFLFVTGYPLPQSAVLPVSAALSHAKIVRHNYAICVCLSCLFPLLRLILIQVNIFALSLFSPYLHSRQLHHALFSRHYVHSRECSFTGKPMKVIPQNTRKFNPLNLLAPELFFLFYHTCI